MTRRRLIPYCLVALLSLTGCLRDRLLEPAGADAGEQVQISFTAFTRGEDGETDEGDDKDKLVTSVRIMGFNAVGGRMAFNQLITDFEVPLYTALADVWTGRYDIVIVANEKADAANLHAPLNAMTRGNNNISQLDALYIDYETTLAGEALHGIPMVSIVRNVTIQGSPIATKIIVGNKEYDKIWELQGDHRLARMLVRVNAVIELTAAQEGVLTDKNNIYFTNLPKRIYLLPRANMPAAAADVIAEKYFTMNLADETDDDKIAAGITHVATAERALLPESLFADPTEKDNGMRIALKFGENLAGANLYSAADNYTVPRNTFIDVTGTVADNGVGLALFLKVENWSDAAVSADALGRKLNVSDTEAAVLYRTVATADEYKIYFWTNQKKVYIEKMGYLGDDMGNQTGETFEVNTVFETLSGDTNGDGSTIASAGKFDFDPSDGSGCITLKPQLTSGANVGRIVLNAGGLRKEILTTTVCTGTLTQPSIYSYVGAFWRARETGERLIRIPAANSTQMLGYGDKGKWMAIVGDENGGQEWIMLDTKASGNAGVWGESFNAVAEGNAAYQVYDGGKTMVSGNTDSDKIYFRIGLKSKLDGGNPAVAPRYGVVYLVYNDYRKVHKIYVRQGEAADYVMVPGDPGMTDAPTRPDAMPWSPYNLTAKTWPNEEYSQIKKRDFKNGGYVNETGDSEVDFAAYPTMAGAHFQWAQATDATGAQWQRRAFNPGLTTFPVIGWDYDQDNDGNSYSSWTWDDELHETCPEGYRRPDIKIESDGVAGNEAWQSFVSTQAKEIANSAWGYYADGYFDRLQVEASEGTSANTAPSVVARGGKDAAYIGRIIFNDSQSSTTHYNASLFVPAAGRRFVSSGELRNAGDLGYGWSRLASSGSNSCYYYVKSDGLKPYYDYYKPGGFPIRCVYDPDYAPPRPPVVDPDEITGAGNAVDIITYVGAFWKANQKGERLISIPVDSEDYVGDWAVQVLDYGVGDNKFSEGDILFEKWDGVLPQNHNANGDVTALSAGATTLMGSVANGEAIAFKIGLDKTIGENEHRYARIIVSFGTKDGKKYAYNRVIWLRQGEAPDYVMAPGDPDVNGDPFDAIGRPDVRKWSPYNLTTKSWADIGGSNVEQKFVHINKRTASGNPFYEPGDTYGTSEPDFVAYPSMAGAHFQWSQSTSSPAWYRRAFNPGVTSVSWLYASFSDWIWEDELHETCPEGYRRPNIMRVEDGVMGNEAWQSFESTKKSANSAWGYYADGYFDRLQMELAEGDDANALYHSAVAKGGKDVAYVGRVVFNNSPNSANHYNASLFIPAAGCRDNNSGALSNAGSYGYFWSRQENVDSTYGTQLSCNFYINDSSLNIYRFIKSFGFTVRCVVDPDYVATP